MKAAGTGKREEQQKAQGSDSELISRELNRGFLIWLALPALLITALAFGLVAYQAGKVEGRRAAEAELYPDEEALRANP